MLLCSSCASRQRCSWHKVPTLSIFTKKVWRGQPAIEAKQVLHHDDANMHPILFTVACSLVTLYIFAATQRASRSLHDLHRLSSLVLLVAWPFTKSTIKIDRCTFYYWAKQKGCQSFDAEEERATITGT